MGTIDDGIGSGGTLEHVKFYDTEPTPSVEELRPEPSLTLCSLSAFARFGGKIAARSLNFMLEAGALDEIIAAVNGWPELTVRVSTYTLRLEKDQVPSSRYDWHIDRIGAIAGSGRAERYDVTDYSRRRSFAVLSHFLSDTGDTARDQEVDSASTEFVLRPASVELPNRWLTTSEVQDRISKCLMPTYESKHCGNGVAAAFTARAIHRPGFAREGGRRFMVRVGAYLSSTSCSPYADHVAIYNPFCDRKTPGPRVRRVGDDAETANAPSWSYPADKEDAINQIFTERGLVHDHESEVIAAKIQNAIETPR